MRVFVCVLSLSHVEQVVKTTLYQPPELPCQGHMRMSISAVGDDGVIYARTYGAGTHYSCFTHCAESTVTTEVLSLNTRYEWSSSFQDSVQSQISY